MLLPQIPVASARGLTINDFRCEAADAPSLSSFPVQLIGRNYTHRPLTASRPAFGEPTHPLNCNVRLKNGREFWSDLWIHDPELPTLLFRNHTDAKPRGELEPFLVRRVVEKYQGRGSVLTSDVGVEQYLTPGLTETPRPD